MKTKHNLFQFCLLCAVALQAVTSGAQPVTNIAAGFGHSLFLKSDGSLWAMGRNVFGQLGDGTFNQTNRPEQVVASNVTAIAAGYRHSLILKSNGSLWAMGDNQYGQLGDGTFNQTNLPEQIVASNVTAIAAGDGYSLFLKNDGSLWGMGGNGVGQLGDGTYNTTNLPEQIVASNVTAIAAGYGHGLFLKSNGSLWGMGANDGGQLGDGTYSTFNGSGTNLPEQIIASNVTAIAAGDFHSLFLKSDGSLWGMGDNGYSELGVTTITGTTNRPVQIVTSNVTAIAAGLDHSLFLRSDGSLWGMGPNSALGNNGGYGVSTVPVQIVASNVTRIAGGNGYSLFLKSDGSLWAMGNNYSGTLGDGTYINTNRPEAIIIITPIITSQPISQTNVAGATVTFLVNAMSSQPMNFQWQKNGTNLFDGGNILGVATNALTITGISDSDTTNYSVILSNSYGSVTSSIVTLTVIYPPIITAQPTNLLVLPGTNVAFGVSLTGSAPFFRYQWRFNGNNLLNATNSIFIIPSVGTNKAGNYSVVITNAAGSATSSNAALTVVVSPKSLTNYAGSTTTFTVTAFSPESLNYQWQKNGTNLVNGSNLSGITNSMLTIASVSDADAANYSAVVSGASGSVTTSNAVLTVNNFPFIASQPQSQTAIAGSNVTFNVTAYGAPPLIFQWYFNGNPVGSPTAGTNYSSYTLTNVGTNQAGNYKVQVVNGYSSVTSSNALLTVIVFVPPTLALQLSAGYPLLNLYGMFGSNFVVQYKTNLANTNWINLLSLTNLSASPYQFLDPAGVIPPARFYRAFMQ